METITAINTSVKMYGEKSSNNSIKFEYLNDTEAKLKSLTDDQLELSFHQAVKTERKIMHIVILHVQEVHHRQLHLKKAKGCLKRYLIEEMKYSATAASRRIEAAKLLNAVPAIADKLESGNLNLTQIGEIHKAIQQAEKIHEEKVSDSYKAQIVESVSGLTGFETQQTCAFMLEIPVVKHESIRCQKDESKIAKIPFTKEQYEKYEKVRGILAHKTFQKKRTQGMADVLETMFDEIIQAQVVLEKKSHSLKPAKNRVITSSEANQDAYQNLDSEILQPDDDRNNPHAQNKGTRIFARNRHAPALTQSDSKADFSVTAPLAKPNPSLSTPNSTDKWNTLTPKRKKLILQRDMCCQYTDYESNTICGSTFNLNVDHVIPLWAGGTNHPTNLRALCRAHNLYREKHH